jgi:predicted esterase
MRNLNAKTVAAGFGASILLSVVAVGCGKSGDSATKDAVQSAAVTQSPVQFGGFLGLAQNKATVYSPMSLDLAKKTLVFSPGAKIGSEKMSGLAKQLAAKGVVTYVVDYLTDLAILQQKIALELATELSRDPSRILESNPELLAWQKSNKEISLAGHSMGGAVLGQFVGKRESSFLKSFLFIGVSSVVGAPALSSDPNSPKVVLITGNNDGLVSSDERSSMEALFQTQTVPVAGVNHFCIADDNSVGDEAKKAEDKATDLTFEECQDAMAEAISVNL